MNYSSLSYNSNNFMSSNDYERWVTVRHLIYRMIERVAKKTGIYGNIMIIGAGTCKDLPMDYICEKFDEIVLVDEDKKSLLDSKIYTKGFDRKVKRIVCDVTGLSDSREDFIKSLHKSKKDELNIIFNSISKKIEDISIIDSFDVFENHFSIVLSDMILTQLVSPYIFASMKNFDLSHLPKCIVDFNNILSKQHLKLLDYLCKSNGNILILCDTFVSGKDNGVCSPFTKIIENNPTLLTNPAQITIDMILNWMNNGHGIIGSNFQGVHNDFIVKNWIQAQTLNFCWWFCSIDKSYFCMLYTYSKK